MKILSTVTRWKRISLITGGVWGSFTILTLIFWFSAIWTSDPLTSGRLAQTAVLFGLVAFVLAFVVLFSVSIYLDLAEKKDRRDRLSRYLD